MIIDNSVTPSDQITQFETAQSPDKTLSWGSSSLFYDLQLSELGGADLHTFIN